MTNNLNIRYVKLKFTVRMEEDCELPKYKASMLRGGIGEMLLRANCIRDRNCDGCDFEEECIVQRTMYSKFKNKPDFVSEGDSVGYVLECESLKKTFSAGDKFSFFLVLYGKTIVYFSQYLNAIFAIGNYGIGKERARFQILSVQNSYRQHIMDGNDIYMSNYQVETVERYVEKRMESMHGKEKIALVFHSPLTIKTRGELLDVFDAEALIRALIRRIYILDCFEDLDLPSLNFNDFSLPEEVGQEHHFVIVPRYSNRKQQGFNLSGIQGEIILSNITEDILKLFLAGEILHAGKNTSFGFGRYVVEAR